MRRHRAVIALRAAAQRSGSAAPHCPPDGPRPNLRSSAAWRTRSGHGRADGCRRGAGGCVDGRVGSARARLGAPCSSRSRPRPPRSTAAPPPGPCPWRPGGRPRPRPGAASGTPGEIPRGPSPGAGRTAVVRIRTVGIEHGVRTRGRGLSRGGGWPPRRRRLCAPLPLPGRETTERETSGGGGCAGAASGVSPPATRDGYPPCLRAPASGG